MAIMLACRDALLKERFNGTYFTQALLYLRTTEPEKNAAAWRTRMASNASC